MKKYLYILCACLFFALASCNHVRCEEKIQVTAATFPVWLFTANIVLNVPNIQLDLLIPAMAGCPHDFVLKPADLARLEKARAVVINGAGLEEFLTKPLASLTRKPDVIDAGKDVPVIDESHDGHTHINPHIFAAPGEACLMARNIAAGLAALDPPNAGLYAKNAAAYMEKLTALSARLEAIGQKAKKSGIVLEHAALAYLAANAGLDITDTIEPPVSPAQLAKIKQSISEKKPRLLAGDSQYPDRILAALSKETGVPFAQLSTCASGPENAPLNYYETEMDKNIKILEKYFD